MNLYLGKLSKNYPEQLTENFYAAGAQGTSWYGGIQPGDYVFPVFQGKIHKLWKVREYGHKVNQIGKDDTGVVFFDTIKEYEKPISLADEFIRYRHFDLDLTLLNKSSKSVRGVGFHEIHTTEQCPPPEQMDFEKDKRKIWITLPQKINSLNPIEGDIHILLDSYQNMNIDAIEIYMANQFQKYNVLWKLYRAKNEEGGRYSLLDLLAYSGVDKAPKKENYLLAVLAELKEKGSFLVINPIALYDNLLVGRKVTKTAKSNTPQAPKINQYQDDNSDEDEINDYEEYQKFIGLLDNNPNLILYGPPGTGKTFLSRKIIEAFDYNKTVKAYKYSQINEQGRAKFITFHQAYSYEEFVEGIRPVFDSNDEANNNLKYKVEDGIIKQLANSASKQEINKTLSESSTVELTESSQIWKVSLGQKNVDGQVYKSCKQKNEIAIGWLPEESFDGKTNEDIYDLLVEVRKDPEIKPTQDANSINAFVNEMKVGDIVFIYDSPTTIRDIGIVAGGYKYETSPDNFQYHHRRKVKWIKEFKTPLDIYEINQKKRLTLKAIYPLNNISFSDLRTIIDSDHEKDKNKSHIPYYLIIDEINRGNVSKIFGELITLIEKDKRSELSCRLPYSQKDFSLPSNIYIIGTMNTADRSLAVLDTALRRRFTFCEIEPNPKIFTDDSDSTLKINDQINLEELLSQINIMISKKLDRDHRIGHSYFMRINSLAQLYIVWYYKIIPLLNEYFYNDVKSLKSIIKSDFFDENDNIKMLSYSSSQGLSDFEIALIKIYKQNGTE